MYLYLYKILKKCWCMKSEDTICMIKKVIKKCCLSCDVIKMISWFPKFILIFYDMKSMIPWVYNTHVFLPKLPIDIMFQLETVAKYSPFFLFCTRSKPTMRQTAFLRSIPDKSIGWLQYVNRTITINKWIRKQNHHIPFIIS